MKPEDLLDEDELKNVMEVDTNLIMPSEEKEEVKSLSLESLPRCGTCGWYDLRDDAKGYCRNIEKSKTIWIEDINYPSLTVTKFFGCIEHTDLKGK